MIFLGFITLFDPPKTKVLETLEKLRHLGVQFKLITGDNALVAVSIAHQIGIPNPMVLTGPEIRQMTDAALMQRAVLGRYFCRS